MRLWMGKEKKKCRLSESKHSALEMYLFGHCSPESISSLLPLYCLFMLKKWKLLAAFQTKGECSDINFQPIWSESLAGTEVIQDYTICLHWRNSLMLMRISPIWLEKITWEMCSVWYYKFQEWQSNTENLSLRKTRLDLISKVKTMLRGISIV